MSDITKIDQVFSQERLDNLYTFLSASSDYNDEWAAEDMATIQRHAITQLLNRLINGEPDAIRLLKKHTGIAIIKNSPYSGEQT